MITPFCYMKQWSNRIHLASEPDWQKILRGERCKDVLQIFLVTFTVTSEFFIWVNSNKFQKWSYTVFVGLQNKHVYMKIKAGFPNAKKWVGDWKMKI